jgi:OmcA/MtrC family decaheme c-type cytochrome
MGPSWRIPSGNLFNFALRIAAFLALIAFCLTGQTKKHQYSPHDKAFYADPALIAFVSPGLGIKINSGAIAANGTITITYTLSDPNGLPLDATGANTPGAISLTYFASYIPQGQEQYVSYTTASATGKVLGTITRPTFEEGGGTLTSKGPGQYQYAMKSQAPAGFDPTVTTTVAVVASRNLTSFNLGTNYAGATFNFVPNGAAVTVTRDVIRTESCNTCHDQLAFHGGHAFGMEQCVLCHQPQNLDPVTGNSLDLKVMAHKIHMGSSLPSVMGTSTTPGVPYQIAGYMNFISDFSKVVDPSDTRRCAVCHSQTSGAAQATAYTAKPSRAACGACHDDVNFATGANHAGGFQTDDTQCSNCHIAKGETPFDASILGAHVVPEDTPATYAPNPDTLISSVVVTITGVTNGAAGQKPVVAYTVKDINGKPIPLANLEDLQFTLAGPTTDYGYTSFGSDVATPGYVGEDGTAGTCNANGNCTLLPRRWFRCASASDGGGGNQLQPVPHASHAARKSAKRPAILRPLPQSVEHRRFAAASRPDSADYQYGRHGAPHSRWGQRGVGGWQALCGSGVWREHTRFLRRALSGDEPHRSH